MRILTREQKEAKKAYARRQYAEQDPATRFTPEQRARRNASALKRSRNQTPEQRERTRVWRRAYYHRKRAENVEKARAIRRKYLAGLALRDPDYHRRANHRKQGLPAATRPRPELCELCERPPVKRVLALDHDKVTGKFRGWLCTTCNTALGSLGDTIPGVQRAITYLEKCQ